MKVATVDEMRTLDQRAVTEFAIPESILMENAGQAAFAVIAREMDVASGRFVVLCGLGNNGGDGLVVARKLHSNGGDVQVFILGDPAKFSDVSKANHEMAVRCGVVMETNPDIERIRMAVLHCDAAVDALLGTGIVRDVGGKYKEVVELLNDTEKTVFALDIPSGVDGNTGAVRGVAVDADWTVTFGLPKRGNVLQPGGELCGRLCVTHISFPPRLQQTEDIKVSLLVPPTLPARKIDGHKGTFGDVLFVAGAANYFGAPAFSALSMLKAGGGYARLAAPRSIVPAVAAIGSEIVFAPQPETNEGTLSVESIAALSDIASGVDFVVLGPGMSLHPDAQELVRQLAAQVERPLLIDGDGLSAVASDTSTVQGRAEPTVLTPHVGEMARLCGKSKEEILMDPVSILQGVCQELNAFVVLKGARSLVGLPDGRVVFNLSGNSGMATAGSGDVLTGAIAAMYGLGLAIEDAVQAGVFLHGLAGDVAADARGEDGITARDILEALPEATQAYRDEYFEITKDFYGTVEIL